MSFGDYGWVMARQLERDRAAGIIHTYSTYESIGITAQSAMLRRRFKTKDLAAAEMIQLAPRGFLPSQNAEISGQFSLAGVSGLAAGAGFEPVATAQRYLAFTAVALRVAVNAADT